MSEHLNRSDRPDMFQDRELLEAVMQKTADDMSVGSRLSSVFLPPHSLRSEGTLSRPGSIVSKNSRPSVMLSQEKLSDVVDSVMENHNIMINNEIIRLHITVLSVLSVCSLILASISIQLIQALSQQETLRQSSELVKNSIIDVDLTYLSVTEVATALSTFVVTLDVTCVFVCTVQCLIVVKLLKVNLGEERALKFVQDCSSFRFVAISGFFVSIPVFLVALVLYMVCTFSKAAAITATVILAVGVVFCVVSAVTNVYHWRVERSRGIAGLPVFEHSSPIPSGEKQENGKELSTLV
ncbi:uncharacterized protein LOC127879359 [Dreissena polymorpha]|uniref:Transmembrane protein n=1 Tax=Dreissena polymorpha TaxID=45954 RepID=A0A9D4QRJ2_DREPO|nr:uncharacterized protein LOC127879359 [Dreissena polymorpha]XP_052282097.1 uncharacterized protein LOC127879359 [Dreissena polymorpha]XP_052282098.1 uncharacterized protein LOC127879359 [Dreissena polymorpha]XP_052282099.1 uncharacterized protein LOC127879359 [Dreissena polymorpha]KAH3840523.1 hypothetical protein DPMN_113973 [Dreissena polymorpha]